MIQQKCLSETEQELELNTFFSNFLCEIEQIKVSSIQQKLPGLVFVQNMNAKKLKKKKKIIFKVTFLHIFDLTNTFSPPEINKQGWHQKITDEKGIFLQSAKAVFYVLLCSS